MLYLFLIPFTGSPQHRLIKDLNQYLFPINTISPEESFSDLVKLKKIFNNARLIGLGEATHGTKEFFVFKHRLLRFLVTEMGFRVFVIEGDFSGAMLMNDFVLYGRGTAYDALKALGVGFWINQDFIDLVEWIRRFNSQCQPNDKIKFYGADMQYPITILKQLRSGLIQLQRPLSGTCLQGLDILINNISYRKLSAPEITQIKNALSEIRLDKPLGMDQEDEQFYLHEIRTIEQALEFGSENRGKQQFALRDRFLSENSIWIYNHENKAKTIIWAHNGHIGKYHTVARSQPMGFYLSEKFNDQYYSLGFGFNSGTVRAASIPSVGMTSIFNVPAVETKKSFDFIFSQCNQPNFILDFKTGSASSEIRDFLNKRYYSRSIGSSYSDAKFGNGKDVHEPLLSLYDGIVFFRQANAALPEIYKN